jgi:DNA-binding NtrC family response regulator
MTAAAPAIAFRAPASVRDCEPEPVARSAAMRALLEAASDVAPTHTTVLLTGESGTGKEVLARWLHRNSPRARGPWVAVNCAALPADLLESELFGHEKGSFTGAGDRRVGRIEQADQGTLLLDEISEMPLPLQAKLLRVLQEREVDRVGGARPVPVDVRVIATTNRDLSQMVAAGLFRQDLYYRLDVFPLALPPLRDRREDLPELAAAILDRVANAHGRAAPVLDGSALRALQSARLPGNVRELGNLLERALVRCRGGVISAAALGAIGNGPSLVAPAAPLTAAMTAANSSPELQLQAPRQESGGGSPGIASESCQSEAAYPAGLPLDLTMLEKLAITEALRRTGGNRTKAAQLLGIGLRTLRSRLNDGGPEGDSQPVLVAVAQITQNPAP